MDLILLIMRTVVRQRPPIYHFELPPPPPPPLIIPPTGREDQILTYGELEDNLPVDSDRDEEHKAEVKIADPPVSH